jgi:hypothetical protein
VLKHPAPTLPELAKRLTPLTESADRVSAGGSSFWGSQETAERPARGQGQSLEILSSSYTRWRAALASLPADATDKLLRYEAHLDRQLYRAMDQLERLRRQRRAKKC